MSSSFLACFPSTSRSRPDDHQPSSARSRNTPSLDWTKQLFGRRRSTTAAGHGRPTSSSLITDNDQEQRQGLLSSSTTLGSDEYDDSDAISLLSNIAERDGHRGSTAARKRARLRRRARSAQHGSFQLFLQDFSHLVTCGLLGRPGHHPHRRSQCRGSHSNDDDSDHPIHFRRRHQRSTSSTSTDSNNSLSITAAVESGDEDAGMLDDQTITHLGLAPNPSRTAQQEPTPSPTRPSTTINQQQVKQPKTTTAETLAEAEAEVEVEVDEDAKAQAESKAKTQDERKRLVQQEAARIHKETLEEAVRQQEEEARLAAEEEADIAKARRKAERKAAKAGLLQLKRESQTAQRWQTEAEAEAAAGGFDFAQVSEEQQDPREPGTLQYFDDDPQDPPFYDHHLQLQQQQQPSPSPFPLPSHDYPDSFYDADQQHAAQPDKYVVQEHHPDGVIHHHHHYYQAPAQPYAYALGGEYLSPTLTSSIHPPLADLHQNHRGAGKDHEAAQDVLSNETAVQSEDEADIAGLSFGNKKSRRNNSESGSRSGGGRIVRGVPMGASSQTSGGSGSGSAYRAYSNGPRTAGVGVGGVQPTVAYASSASSSNAGKAPSSYRVRPRRHERHNSRSSNSSSGLNYGLVTSSGSPLALVGTSASSTTSPLPNLYEQEAGTGFDSLSANVQPPNPLETIDDFGVSGAEVAGAGSLLPTTTKVHRSKKSYREKRVGNGETTSATSNSSSLQGKSSSISSPPQPPPPPQEDNTFEGFPGF